MSMKEVETRLIALAMENGGVLTTEAVLEDAEDEDSPLHSHFEWDDSKAAANYRKWQARELIAKVRITREAGGDERVRVFVSVPSDRAEGGYRLMDDVANDEARMEELKADMRSRIAYWTRQRRLLDSRTAMALDELGKVVAASEPRAAA